MGMAGRDVVTDIGDVALPRCQRADLDALLTRLNPARGAHHVAVLHAQQSQRMRRRDLVLARDRRCAQRAWRRRGAATGRMSVVDGIGHRRADICRATHGDKQHQDGLGALGGHELSRLRQALERIAIEIRVLMAFLECPHHGLASGAAHHIGHGRGVHGIATAQGQLRHNARGRGAVIGKITFLQRADRRAHDEARNPGTIGGTTLRTTAVGERAAREHQAAQFDMAQVRCALKDVKHCPARGELSLRSHGLALLGRRDSVGYFGRPAKGAGSRGSAGKRRRHGNFRTSC